MSHPPNNNESRSDLDHREDRLVEWARQMDEHLANGQAEAISESLSAVSADELPDLQHVERALLFLDRARDNLGVLAHMAVAAEQDSQNAANDSTRHGMGATGSHDAHAVKDIAGIPSKFGRFEILDVLGQGGFAKVFLANDPLLNRLVALKIPLKQTFEDRDARRRFEREARAAAVLSHPAIVPIYETGVEDKTAYIAFGYCPGLNLSEWFAKQRGKIRPRSAAAIVAKLAEATQHAHQRGIVHRDLKPGNVLLHCEPAANDLNGSGTVESRQDDVGVRRSERLPSEVDDIADQVRITDFGLARFESSFDETITIEGSVIGTPAYMSPEQARGQRDVGPASDIFSLGAILYELLTAERPFIRETHLSTLRAIEEDTPRSPRHVRVEVPKDLEAICLKCLRKSPEQRYATAHELADDLTRWINGQPILARPASSWEKVQAWSKRNPALSAALLLGFVSFATGLAGTTWQWQKAQANLALSEAEYARAEQAIAEETQARERAEQVTQFLSFTYRSTDPELDGRDAKVVDMLARARHEIPVEFANDDETRWMLQRQIAAAYMKLGIVKDSLNVLEPIWHERQSAGRTESIEVVELLKDLSVAANFAADQQRSLDYSNQALDLAKQLVATDRMVAKCQQAKAVALQNLGQRAEAIDCYRTAIEYFERDPNSEPHSALTIKYQLGMALRATGNLDEAAALLEESMTGLRQVLGPDHPDVINATAEYANVLHAQGRKLETIELRESLVASRERVQGPEHPRTLMEMTNWAAALTSVGRAVEAVPILESCVEKAQRVMGTESPYTLMPVLQLGVAYRKTNRLDMARTSFETAYAGMRTAFGPTHQWTAKCTRRLGQVLEWTGDWTTVAELYRQRIDDFTTEYGVDHETARLFHALLGTVQIRLDDVEAGVAAVDGYLESLDTSDEPSQQIAAKMHARMVSALIASERFDAAEPLTARYRVLIADQVDTKHDFYSRVQRSHVLMGLDRMDEAAECLRPCCERGWVGELELENQDWDLIADSVMALTAHSTGEESPFWEFREELAKLSTTIPGVFK